MCLFITYQTCYGNTEALLFLQDRVIAKMEKQELLLSFTNEVIFFLSGVEKKNDDFRRYFHRKINRWDACQSLLLVEKRRESLQEYGRGKRCYVKRDTHHLAEGGKSEVIRKIPRISNEVRKENNTSSYTYLLVLLINS